MKVKVRRRLKKKVKISLVAILIFTFLFLGGFNTIKSAYIGLRDYFGVGQVPAHTKDITDNGNGTYKLSLDALASILLTATITFLLDLYNIFLTSKSF